MVIELFGLPGAGKTTLAKELSLATGIPIVRLSLFQRIFEWKMYALKNLTQAFHVVRFLFHHATTHRYELFMNGCVDRYGRFSYAKKHGGIIDEGPLQNILSFPSRTLFAKEMDVVVASLPHPDVVIHVIAFDADRALRQEKRGWSMRSEAWIMHAKENERLALMALPPGVLVLEYPTRSISEIVATIGAL
jgi:hypothetical protein